MQYQQQTNSKYSKQHDDPLLHKAMHQKIRIVSFRCPSCGWTIKKLLKILGFIKCDDPKWRKTGPYLR